MAAIHEQMRPVVGTLMVRLGFDLEETTSLTMSEGPVDISMRTSSPSCVKRYGDALEPLRAAALLKLTALCDPSAS